MQPRVLSAEVKYEGKWLNYCSAKVQGKEGNIYDWEYASRTCHNDSSADAVILLPILHKKDKDMLVLIRQLRPAVNKTVIELPAGLIDKGETPKQAGIRELKEETGFIGTPREESYPMFFSYDITNTDEIFIFMDIDGEAQENQSPQQTLELTESIDVFTVDIDKLDEELKRLHKEGYAIDGRLFTFAKGWEFCKQFSNKK